MRTAEIFFFDDANNGDALCRKADRMLVKQAAAGDRRAFQLIVERNKQRMFSVARSTLGRRYPAEDVEDVVQEAFIKAYRGLADFRGDAALSTWLYRIAYVTAIDHQRQQNRHVQLAQSVETEVLSDIDGIPASNTGAPASEFEAGRLGREIDAALASLTHFEQTIFTLRHMQNFKLREIAVVVDCAEGTVKNILFRAIRKLRDHLHHLQDRQCLPQEIERC